MENKGSYFNLDETYRQAAVEFANLNPGEAAEKAGADYNPESNTVAVRFIDTVYSVNHPEAEVKDPHGNKASVYIAILILHYLVNAGGAPLTGRWISFRHLPGGDIYIDPFQKRAVLPFLKTFGNTPEKFLEAALKLGGEKVEQSGISVVVKTFPRVPICFTIWPGDDELPASATILFDETAPDYLPTEDYAHLPAMVNGAMKSKLGS